METHNSPYKKNPASGLETFLVEWKRVWSLLRSWGEFCLETFLVEWKLTFSAKE